MSPSSVFDPVTQVDIPTVEFGPKKANAIGQRVEDINGDGLDDLVLLFNIAESGISTVNISVALSGFTFTPQLFRGEDIVRVIDSTPVSMGGGGGGSFYLLPLLLLVLIAIKKFR